MLGIKLRTWSTLANTLPTELHSPPCSMWPQTSSSASDLLWLNSKEPQIRREPWPFLLRPKSTETMACYGGFWSLSSPSNSASLQTAPAPASVLSVGALACLKPGRHLQLSSHLSTVSTAPHTVSIGLVMLVKATKPCQGVQYSLRTLSPLWPPFRFWLEGSF